MRRFWSFLLGSFVWGAVFSAAAEHAFSLYGDLKYPADFSHFEYVSPDAPKGGVLKQAALGSFDTFNPFSMTGIPAAGIMLTHDTLMKQSADEAFSLYGLIADDVRREKGSVSFHINPSARFSDGSPITAEDVVFSFYLLKEKGIPTYRYYYKDVDSAEALDSQNVRFSWNADIQNAELPLILGELPVLSKTWWAGRDFSKTSLDIPVSSGPYIISSHDPGRFVSYRLNPKYWAADLNVNRGFYNFDEIRYDYYRDTSVIMEAFKSGLVDVRQENEAKRWINMKKETAVKDGRIILKETEHHLPSGMQGFIFNMRRPLFSDRRVRQALSLVFDFDWTNQTLFSGLYKRTESFFDNSDLRAPPLPSEKERALLLPFKTELPPEIFSDVFSLPENKTPAQIRHNLKHALDLLEEAGWQVRNGRLENEDGQIFRFEILLDSVSVAAWERVTLPYLARLKRLGIEASVRVVDPIQYKNRLDAFDYDMIVAVWGQSLSPGNEQRYFWGSAAADTKGSSNYAGLKSPVADALIDTLIRAQTRDELRAAVHALDRVLLRSYFVVPHWYANVQRFAFQSRLCQPSVSPLKGMDILTWWICD